MKRLLAVAILLVVAALGASEGETRKSKGEWRAFVAAENDDQLVAVRVSGRSGTILRRIRVANGPHNVAAAARRGDVLVTSPPAGRLTLVDARTLRIIKVFGGFTYPHDVKVDPEERYAYVTDERRDEVVVISLTRRRVVRRVAVPAGPHDLAISPGGGQMWVTHGPGARHITILRTVRPSRARVVGRVDAGGPAHDIAFSPSGNQIWVTYWNSSVAGLFFAAGRRLVTRVRVGEMPHHLAVGLRVTWITDNAGGAAYLLASGSGKILRRVHVGAGPHHVAFEGGTAAVVSHDEGTLNLFRAADGRRLNRFPVGRGLHGVATVILP